MLLEIRIEAFRRYLFLILLLTLTLAFQNCSNTKFSSDSSAQAPSDQPSPGDDQNTPASQQQQQQTGGTNPGDDGSTPAASGTAPGNDPTVLCPLKVTTILIIDLKSGWWEGDGSGTFGNIAKQINNQCNQIVLEYGHITNSSLNSGNFPAKSFNDYDEIWILSGAVDDGADLRLNSPTFQRFLNGIVNSSANLFLGTGNGAIYHTNAITTALGFGELVLAGGQSTLAFTLPSNNNVKALTEIAKNRMRENHPLFANVEVLADTITVNGITLVSDKLVSNPNLDFLVTNSSGVPEIGRLSLGTRKIILDADLGRMYAILNNDSSTRNYIVNLMTTLRK